MNYRPGAYGSRSKGSDVVVTDLYPLAHSCHSANMRNSTCPLQLGVSGLHATRHCRTACIISSASFHLNSFSLSLSLLMLFFFFFFFLIQPVHYLCIYLFIERLFSYLFGVIIYLILWGKKTTTTHRHFLYQLCLGLKVKCTLSSYFPSFSLSCIIVF